MTNTTMNTGAASLSDEQIEALKAAALAATPHDIDGAQRIDRYEDGSQILCPACGGEGYVELNTDFCNYDGEALGVQFYGIGNAHALAEAYFRAAKPATVLALIERLERAEATPAQQADAAIAAGGAQEAECTCAAKDMPFGRCCKAPPILAAEHRGMRVDYSGMFKQAISALKHGAKEPGIAEMLRQLKDHMAELGQRWYAGYTAVVDELLQLYCVERDARVTLADPAAASNGEKKNG